MTDKASRWNHPRWHLLIGVPLFIGLITQDGVISRCLLGSAVVLGSIRYGRESATWNSVKTAPEPDITA